MKLKVISMMTFSVLLYWIYSIGGSKIKVVFAHLSSALEQRCKFIIAERSFKKSMIRLPQPNLRCSLSHQHQRSGDPSVQKECVKCLYFVCDHKILPTFICDHKGSGRSITMATDWSIMGWHSHRSLPFGIWEELSFQTCLLRHLPCMMAQHDLGGLSCLRQPL